MSNRNIASLAFKLAGIYVLVEAIPVVQDVLYVTTNWLYAPAGVVAKYQWMSLFCGAVLPLLLTVILATTLLIKSKALGRRTADRSEAIHGPILAIHALCFSVVGLFLIGSGLPALGAALSRVVDGRQSLLAVLSASIAPLLKLLCGMAFFFGSHGLARFWSRLRYSGLRRQMGLCVRCGYEMTGNTSGRCPECGERFIEPARTE